MPFDSGNITLTFFRLPASLPENVLDLLHAGRAGTLDAVKTEPVYGWVSGRHLLESDINEETAICGGHIYINLRKAERKIPSTLLTAICRREELVFMQANDCTVVPRKVRRQIKQDAMEKHLMKMPPSLTATPVVIDKNSNNLYLGTASNAQIDDFVSKFINAVGIEPHQITPDYIMEVEMQSTSFDIPILTIADENDDTGYPTPSTPARDFLTWLWYYMENEGEMLEIEDLGLFGVCVDGPLTFAYSDNDRGETTIKKGNPLRSPEAQTALTIGKKLKKSKLMIARDTQIWSCTFDADKFAFSGLTLPEGEEMGDVHSVFEERITNIEIFRKVITAFFVKYVNLTTSDDWKDTEAKIVKWAEERETL